jgi:hypothetical protein
MISLIFVPKKNLTVPGPDDIECAVYQVFRKLLIWSERLPVGSSSGAVDQSLFSSGMTSGHACFARNGREEWGEFSRHSYRKERGQSWMSAGEVFSSSPARHWRPADSASA